mmetsp:Transcript_49657/g.125103  ORF Transcript_49657/g.125103 Transcript_49657/m.125103 type:complete len:248 (-) Transcript_49657:477-1220(-)
METSAALRVPTLRLCRGAAAPICTLAAAAAAMASHALEVGRDELAPCRDGTVLRAVLISRNIPSCTGSRSLAETTCELAILVHVLRIGTALAGLGPSTALRCLVNTLLSPKRWLYISAATAALWVPTPRLRRGAAAPIRALAATAAAMASHTLEVSGDELAPCRDSTVLRAVLFSRAVPRCRMNRSLAERTGEFAILAHVLRIGTALASLGPSTALRTLVNTLLSPKRWLYISAATAALWAPTLRLR